MDYFSSLIDDAQPVGRLGVVDLVELFVDDLEELLLFGMRGDQRGGGLDRGVVGFQYVERVAPDRPGEEGILQPSQFARDVVLAVILAVVEDLSEDLLGQDVLDQHLAHVIAGQGRVDRLLRMGKEPRRLFGKGRVAGIGRGDGHAQAFKDRRQVGLELVHGRAEFGDLGAFPGEEQRQEPAERVNIRHRAAHDLDPVLDQHRRFAVLEQDVVLRIAVAQLLFDLAVEDVGGVLRLPVALRHAQFVQHGAVQLDDVLLRPLHDVFHLQEQTAIL